MVAPKPQADTGIIADDITGGVLAATALVAQGIACPVALVPEAVADLPDADALLYAGRLRFMEPAAARSLFARAHAALRNRGAGQVLYKYCATFDSTDEGNIGPLADVLLEVSGARGLGFCTAYPERGVTVYQGHIFLHDRLLCHSEKRFDPITPMPDPDLVAVLQRQTAHRVALVPHQLLAAGPDRARAAVEAAREDGARYFVFDGVDARDIAVCAEITLDWPAMTGGDSLVRHLPAMRLARRRGPVPALPALPSGRTAVIAGSCAAATLRQLDALAMRHPVLRLPLEAAVDAFDAVLSEALDWAEGHLASGPIAISVGDEPDAVAALQNQIGLRAAQALGERMCGALAAGLEALGVSRFLVAGGETSGAVVEALGVRMLDVFPHPRLPGGLCIDRTGRRAFHFKAGKMGADTIFHDLLDILREASQ